ncbi:hypothetical protein Sjap_020444 [Stephania japonica]|uniref:Uncharacterized protein n=1 Tax=Stephania japonica TaxID=461633 RepID=A0AAP0F3D8_9MAGN
MLETTPYLTYYSPLFTPYPFDVKKQKKTHPPPLSTTLTHGSLSLSFLFTHLTRSLSLTLSFTVSSRSPSRPPFPHLATVPRPRRRPDRLAGRLAEAR